MELKEAIDDIKTAIAEVKKEGKSTVEVTNLENYLAFLERQAAVSAQLRDHAHESSLAQYNAINALNVEMFRSVMDAGKEAINAAILLNGGAVIALMAFVGNAAGKRLARCDLGDGAPDVDLRLWRYVRRRGLRISIYRAILLRGRGRRRKEGPAHHRTCFQRRRVVDDAHSVPWFRRGCARRVRAFVANPIVAGTKGTMKVRRHPFYVREPLPMAAGGQRVALAAKDDSSWSTNTKESSTRTLSATGSSRRIVTLF